jgi:hypothetical protein
MGIWNRDRKTILVVFSGYTSGNNSHHPKTAVTITKWIIEGRETRATANGLLWRDVHRRKTLTLNCSSIVKCRSVWHHYAIVGPKREHSCPRVILSATKWTWEKLLSCGQTPDLQNFYVIPMKILHPYYLFSIYLGQWICRSWIIYDRLFEVR